MRRKDFSEYDLIDVLRYKMHVENRERIKQMESNYILWFEYYFPQLSFKEKMNKKRSRTKKHAFLRLESKRYNRRKIYRPSHLHSFLRWYCGAYNCNRKIILTGVGFDRLTKAVFPHAVDVDLYLFDDNDLKDA